ncbi:MAG: alkaline phosphatase family protein [Planctomycetota bacterium]
MRLSALILAAAVALPAAGVAAPVPAPLPAPAPSPLANDDAPARPGVFVLGIDGLDPVILQRLMDAGQLPNFARLAAEGTFQPLGSVNPPQSPVAWSSFVTGLDPGGHGIFDFIHRDPKSYLAISSATAPPSGEHPPTLELFGYVFPLGGEEVPNARSGAPFWDRLQAAGIPAEVYRMPGNFPVPTSEALTLSGMGTVDMRGQYGLFTWYTNDAFTVRSDKGELEIVTLEDEDLDGRADTARSRLKGPPDIFRLQPGQVPGREDYLSVPVTFHLDPEEDVLLVRAGSAEAVVREGEFSEWLQVSFDALPAGLMPMTGIVRFYAKELRPNFRVYATPVNIDPTAPTLPIATPDGAAEALAEAVGFYWTQGFPEEINALKAGLFNDDDYAVQIAYVHEEAGHVLDEALRRFQPGSASFVYLSDIDLQCHMLWRHGDPKTPQAPRHPGWDSEFSERHALDIEQHYRNADALLGRTRAALPQDTLLIAMSDHGFQTQTRQFHLNAWLRDEGYLVLRDKSQDEPDSGVTAAPSDTLGQLGYVGTQQPGGSPVVGKLATPTNADTGELDFERSDIDWSATRAYGLGFNSLYLNRRGREVRGIVGEDQADALMAEIAAKLVALRDPQGGAQVVLRVDRATDIYAPDRLAEAPDLLVGYDAGYGCSDESTLGEITVAQFSDNLRGFTGNHLMAPELVPGCLLVNRKLPGSGHDLMDLTATLLDYFGVPLGEGMKGRSILQP